MRLRVLVGAAVWIVLALAAGTGIVRLSLVDVLLVLAPLVAVPLGMDLLPVPDPGSLLQTARRLQPIGAGGVVAALLLPAGWVAGGLATLWLVPSGLVGLVGIYLLFRTRSLRPTVLAPAAAMGFLAIGGGWLVLSRAGLRPGGFSSDIVELTAVHFHFAGFAATLMAALTGAMVSGRQLPRRAAAAGVYLMIAGIPIVASSITLALPPLTVLGAVLLATGVLLVAAVNVLVVVPAVRGGAGITLAVSASSVFLPMLLAVLYTARPVFATPALGLRDMAATHGVLNSLAFSVVGLLGWHMARAQGAFRTLITSNAQA